MNMWGSGSNTISGTSGPKNDSARPGQTSSDCSDDEISLTNSRDDGFGVPHFLEVLQYRGKRALRLMVWPHPVKTVFLGYNGPLWKCPLFQFSPLFSYHARGATCYRSGLFTKESQVSKKELLSILDG